MDGGTHKEKVFLVSLLVVTVQQNSVRRNLKNVEQLLTTTFRVETEQWNSGNRKNVAGFDTSQKY